MKDKLYKLNKGQKYYLLKRVFIGTCLLIASSILFAIPLSVSLVNENNLAIANAKKDDTILKTNNEKNTLEEEPLLNYAD